MNPSGSQFSRCGNCGGAIAPTQKSQSVKDSKNIKGMSEFHADAHDCQDASSKNWPRGGRSGTEDVKDWDYGD